MKNIIYIILLLCAAIVSSAQPIGSPTTSSVVKGTLAVDSAYKPPIYTDTPGVGRRARFVGSTILVAKSGDTSEYIYKSGRWNKVVVGSESQSVTSTIQQLIDYSGQSLTVSVLDPIRGDDFDYVPSGLTVDSGLVFPAVGKGGGYWRRRWNGIDANLAWWGFSTSAIDNGKPMQRAVNSPFVSNLYASPGTYNFSREVFLKNNLNIYLGSAVLRNSNITVYTMASNVSAGATFVPYTNADQFFEIGDRLGLADNNMPVASNDNGETRLVYNVFVVTAVSSTGLTISEPLSYAATVAASSIIFRCNAIFIWDNIHHANVYGGVFELNKQNRYPGDGVINNGADDDEFSERGWAFLNAKNCKVEGATVQNGIYHNVSVFDHSDSISFINCNNLYPAHKGLLLYGRADVTDSVRNVLVDGGIYRGSGIEDNITAYLRVSGLTVRNATIDSADRWGFRGRQSVNINFDNCVFDYNGTNFKAADITGLSLKRSLLKNNAGWGSGLQSANDRGSLCLDNISAPDIKEIVLDSLISGDAMVVFNYGGDNAHFRDITIKNFWSATKPVWTYNTIVFPPSNFILESIKYLGVNKDRIYYNGTTYFGELFENYSYVSSDVVNFPMARAQRITSDLNSTTIGTPKFYNPGVALNVHGLGGMGGVSLSRYDAGTGAVYLYCVKFGANGDDINPTTELLNITSYGRVNGGDRFAGNIGFRSVAVVGNNIISRFSITTQTASNNETPFSIDTAANVIIGTGAYNIDGTANLHVEGTTHITGTLRVGDMQEYADNAAAITAGLPVDAFYRTGDVVKVVH